MHGLSRTTASCSTVTITTTTLSASRLDCTNSIIRTLGIDIPGQFFIVIGSAGGTKIISVVLIPAETRISIVMVSPIPGDDDCNVSNHRRTSTHTAESYRNGQNERSLSRGFQGRCTVLCSPSKVYLSASERDGLGLSAEPSSPARRSGSFLLDSPVMK